MKKGAAVSIFAGVILSEAQQSKDPAEIPPVMLWDLIPSIAFAQPAAFPSMSRLPQPLHSRLRSE
jgi:hypothetical protein